MLGIALTFFFVEETLNRPMEEDEEINHNHHNHNNDHDNHETNHSLPLKQEKSETKSENLPPSV